MYLDCRRWRLFCLFLLLPLSTNSQFYDTSDSDYKSQSSQFTDPIRRALGLWSRLLNRMSQTDEPTDDQLHLRVGNDGEKSAFEDLELPNLFGTLNTRRDQNDRLPPVQRKEGFSLSGSGSDSIINEEKLNQLLPRTSSTGIQEDSGKEKDGSGESNKTTESSSEITTKDSNKDTSGLTKKAKPNSKGIEKSSEDSGSSTTGRSSKNKTAKKSTKKSREFTQSLEQNDDGSIQNTRHERQKEKNDSSTEAEENEVEKKTTTRTTTTSTEPATIQVINNVVTKTKKPQRERGKSAQHSMTSTKIQQSKLKTVINVTVHDLKSTTQLLTAPTTEPTTRSLSTTTRSKSKKVPTTTEPGVDYELLSTTTGDEFQSSGVEPEGEDGEEKKTRRTTTTHPKTSTTLGAKKSTTTAAITTKARPTASKKPKWSPQRTRKPPGKEGLNNRDETVLIPEAEEAEFQSDEQPTTTAVPKEPPSSELDETNSASYSDEESQENERKVEKMLTPVIDGIGPLILPLLGYSRQTINGIFNPAPATVPAAAVRTSGVRNFSPQQAPTQIVRQSAQQQPLLDGLLPFDQVVAPFQRNMPTRSEYGSSFKQDLDRRKSYSSSQSHVRNHIVEPVSLPPASYFNNRRSESSFVQPTRQVQEVSDSPSIVPVDASPTYNRMINAETYQRHLPDPPYLAKQNLPPMNQAEMLEIYKQILARRGLRGPSLRGINEDQIAQIAQLIAKIPRTKNPSVSINPASEKEHSEIRRQPSVDDPGYQMGRSNVISSFYENSGLMVGTNPGPSFSSSQPQSISNSIHRGDFGEDNQSDGDFGEDNQSGRSFGGDGQSGGGFGGGRRPDSSFEQAALVTGEDGRTFF